MNLKTPAWNYSKRTFVSRKSWIGKYPREKLANNLHCKALGSNFSTVDFFCLVWVTIKKRKDKLPLKTRARFWFESMSHLLPSDSTQIYPCRDKAHSKPVRDRKMKRHFLIGQRQLRIPSEPTGPRLEIDSK